MALMRTVPGTGEIRGWSWSRTWLATFAVLLGATLVVGRELYFGSPLFEVGDLAANALQIDRAKEFTEIYGNYSRFGFHHPGPAFFYVYAAAEIFFRDVLGLSPAPHNAHLLGAAILQAALLATAIAALAIDAGTNRGLFLGGATAIAIVHFTVSGQHQYSIWPPSAIVVPFAAYLSVAIALSGGWIGLLPLLVLIGGFLVHGHVAQPTFVLPLGGVGYVMAIRELSRRGSMSPLRVVRASATAHLAALVVLGVFLVPIAIDLARGPSSNMELVLQTLTATRAPEDQHDAVEVAGYLISFFGYPTGLGELEFTPQTFREFMATNWPGLGASLVLIVVAPAAYLAFARARRTARPAWSTVGIGVLRRIWLFVGLALCLAVVWAFAQRGPLYQFNSYFMYGLIFVALLPIAILASGTHSSGAVRAGSVVVVISVVGFAAVSPNPGHLGEPPTLADRTREVVLASPPPSAGILLKFDGMHWNAPAGVALALERLGVPWYVEPHWGLIFGYDRVYQPVGGQRPPVVWTLVPPGRDGRGHVELSPAVALRLSSDPGEPASR